MNGGVRGEREGQRRAQGTAHEREEEGERKGRMRVPVCVMVRVGRGVGWLNGVFHAEDS